jgi:hypothetical protein
MIQPVGEADAQSNRLTGRENSFVIPSAQRMNLIAGGNATGTRSQYDLRL